MREKKNIELKIVTGEGQINGGFILLKTGDFKYLDGNDTGLKEDVLEQLATNGHLAAYWHAHFWQYMDLLRAPPGESMARWQTNLEKIGSKSNSLMEPLSVKLLPGSKRVA